MASPLRSATPEIVLPNICDSPYNSKIITITVGQSRRIFSVHEAKLAQTRFMEVHQRIVPAKDPPTDLNDDSEELDVAIVQQVKSEDGSVRYVPGMQVDYHIQDRFLLVPDAFQIFVNYLYNEPLAVITTSRELKRQFKAYGIARQYKCYGLQNRILSSVRVYYTGVSIDLDDLIWVANRFGDDVTCSLNAYLVEQIAFEIAHRGYSRFAQNNPFLTRFLEQGDRGIRVCLFRAIARYSTLSLKDKDENKHDPSKRKKNFYVYERGPRAGEPKD